MSTNYKIYGIPNCGSVKKAISFFEDNNIAYEFINFKKEAISPALIDDWMTQFPLNVIVNTKGTSWRTLDADIKAQTLTPELAKTLILENNSLVKRPVITLSDKIIAIGYDEVRFSQLFLNK